MMRYGEKSEVVFKSKFLLRHQRRRVNSGKEKMGTNGRGLLADFIERSRIKTRRGALSRNLEI